jgi:uncharacterized protein YkwD
MRKSIIAIVLIGIFLLIPQQSKAFSERGLVKLTNQNRTKALKLDPKLSFVAQTKANDMVNKDYFGHTTPDGHRFFYFFQQLNYSYQSAGENLAVDYKNNKEVVDAWMASSSHKANIINPRFTKVGIGIAHKGEHYYIVQLFAQP